MTGEEIGLAIDESLWGIRQLFCRHRWLQRRGRIVTPDQTYFTKCMSECCNYDVCEKCGKKNTKV